MSKKQKIDEFDPNGPGLKDSNIYGLPFNEEEADIILLPVPWEVTVSYGGGTLNGPEAIREASLQVDLFDSDEPETWKAGIFMHDIDKELKSLSQKSRLKAEKYIEALSEGANEDEFIQTINEIENACETMISFVEEKCSKILSENKVLGLIGGDHSTPLGFIQALSKKHDSFGILQIDAHMDLRIAYEGFKYSHASIMYNALQIPQVTKLVQVGIRDYCSEEIEVMNTEGNRVKTFFDHHLKRGQFEGKLWHTQVDEIISTLPQKVYLSFDIDGLDPVLCPNTGTPVPGGLTYHEAVYLIKKICDSGKEIIGFDLNEVSPGENDWDANVAARLLFKLCVFAAKSQRRL